MSARPIAAGCSSSGVAIVSADRSRSSKSSGSSASQVAVDDVRDSNCAVLIATLWSPLAGAQAASDSSRFVISGVVVDPITGDPLEGVSAHIVGTTLGSRTSRTGAFSIRGTVLKRPWRLQVRQLCYETLEIPFEFRDAEDSLRVPHIRLPRRTNVAPPGSVIVDCSHMRHRDGARPLRSAAAVRDAAPRPVVITGVVVDSASGRKLHGTPVNVRGTTDGALTDSGGAFRITATLAGESFVVQVRRIGYQSVERTISVDSVRDSLDLGRIQTSPFFPRLTGIPGPKACKFVTA